MKTKRSAYAASNKPIAERGKGAEKAVRDHLEKLARARANFAFERRYDARSAGGRFPAQAGDFGYFRCEPPPPGAFNHGINGLIEVKELEHESRIPQKNFSDKRINRLTAREMAGTEIVILVLHTSTGLWRCPPFSVFRDTPTAPSWDLSNYPTFDDVELALRAWPALCL